LVTMRFVVTGRTIGLVRSAIFQAGDCRSDRF
jgi:hypothetical protein